MGQTVLASAKTNLKLRYSLLKYYYSIFVAKRGLGTIFKPLFFEFPFDSNTYLDDIVDTQFLIGSNLMAAPVVEKGATERKVYFPDVNWVSLQTGNVYAANSVHIIPNKLTDPVPLFVR